MRRHLSWILLFALGTAGNSAASEEPGSQASRETAIVDTVSYRQSVPLSSPDLSTWQFELADNCIMEPGKKSGHPSPGPPLPPLECPIDPTKVAGAEDRPIQNATQRLLYNQLNLGELLNATSFANLGGQVVYVFLPEQGDILAKAAYDYNTIKSRHSVVSGPGVSGSVEVDRHDITPLLQYAITDDLTIGGQITWSSSSTTVLTQAAANLAVRKDEWQDPILLASYRVVDQPDAPVTTFIRGYYRSAISGDMGNAWGMGGTVLRSEDWFVIGASVDAIYFAQFRSGSVRDSNWRYWTTLEAAAELSDRWAIGMGFAYSFSHDEVRRSPSFDLHVHQAGAASISAGIGYMLVPDKITVAAFAGHQFNSTIGTEKIGDDQDPNGFAVDSIYGAYTVGLTVSASLSPNGLW